MKNIIVVVDMQKDFLLPDGKLYIGHDTKDLVKNVSEVLTSVLTLTPETVLVITKDWHEESDVEFNTFPPHCIKETKGAELVDEIQEAINNFIETKEHKDVYEYRKRAYGVDKFDDLVSNIVAGDIQNVSDKEVQIVVMGVCTHICVHDVTIGLINAFKNKGNIMPRVGIVKEFIDDFDPEMAQKALERLTKIYGVTIL